MLQMRGGGNLLSWVSGSGSILTFLGLAKSMRLFSVVTEIVVDSKLKMAAKNRK